MPHFFVKSENIKNNIIEILDADLLKHLVSALRLNVGEQLKLFDESKTEYLTKVLEVSKNKVLVEIENQYNSHRCLDLNIYLMASILKQDAFFELISGVTQLGIKGLYPVYTDNTVPSKAQIENKTQKWQKISDESVKQCERADFMKVFETTDFKTFDYNSFDEVIVFSEKEKEITLKNVLKNSDLKNKKILVIVGPEGGFSKDEFEFFDKMKFKQVKISELIFKAQNACIAGLSNVIYELSEE